MKGIRHIFRTHDYRTTCNSYELLLGKIQNFGQILIQFPLFPNSWGFGCCVTSGLSSKYSIVPTFRRRASSVAGDSNADYILRKESVRKTAIKAPKVCESCTKYVPPHAILLYIQNINTLQLYNKIYPFSQKRKQVTELPNGDSREQTYVENSVKFLNCCSQQV